MSNKLARGLALTARGLEITFPTFDYVGKSSSVLGDALSHWKRWKWPLTTQLGGGDWLREWHDVTAPSAAGLGLLPGHSFGCNYRDSLCSHKALLSRVTPVQKCFSNASTFNDDITEP